MSAYPLKFIASYSYTKSAPNLVDNALGWKHLPTSWAKYAKQSMLAQTRHVNLVIVKKKGLELRHCSIPNCFRGWTEAELIDAMMIRGSS